MQNQRLDNMHDPNTPVKRGELNRIAINNGSQFKSCRHPVESKNEDLKFEVLSNSMNTSFDGKKKG